MFSSLLNHSFLLQMGAYVNGWTYDEDSKLLNLLKKYTDNLEKTSIPVIGGINNLPNEKLIKTGFNNLNILRGQLKSLDIKLKNINDEKQYLENTLHSLNAEKTKIFNNERLDDISKFIKDGIDKLDKLNKEENDLNILRDKINPVNKFNDIKKNEFSSGKKPTYDRNISKMYDKVFSDFLNNKKLSESTNFRIYPELWKIYVDSNNSSTNNMINITNIHYLVNRLLSDLIKDTNNTNLENYNLCENLYNKIFVKFAKNYEELPEEFNNVSNFALDNVLTIMTHVIKHTLITSYYHSLVKIIRKHLETSRINETNTDITNNLAKILGNPTILDYIFNKLPLLLVKVNSKVYDGDSDPDRKYDNNILLSRTNSLILSSTLLSGKDSNLSSVLEESIKPYFIEYFNLVIPMLKLFADTYMKYIIVTGRNLSIYKLLVQKSLTEIYNDSNNVQSTIFNNIISSESTSIKPTILTPVDTSIKPTVITPVDTSIKPTVITPVDTSIKPTVITPVDTSIKPTILTPVDTSIKPTVLTPVDTSIKPTVLTPVDTSIKPTELPIDMFTNINSIDGENIENIKDLFGGTYYDKLKKKPSNISDTIEVFEFILDDSGKITGFEIFTPKNKNPIKFCIVIKINNIINILKYNNIIIFDIKYRNNFINLFTKKNNQKFQEKILETVRPFANLSVMKFKTDGVIYKSFRSVVKSLMKENNLNDNIDDNLTGVSSLFNEKHVGGAIKYRYIKHTNLKIPPTANIVIYHTFFSGNELHINKYIPEITDNNTTFCIVVDKINKKNSNPETDKKMSELSQLQILSYNGKKLFLYKKHAEEFANEMKNHEIEFRDKIKEFTN
jgi:hypothetical protein